MKKLIVFLAFTALIFILYFTREQPTWEIQSVDTMKYSRDKARETLKGSVTQTEIDHQIVLIAQTGATHVAIGTPYDKEFLPVMKIWVASARKNGLHVWFRGNFSGWEGWFEYPRITPERHTALTDAFIRSNAELFEDGDIFTSCTECENGLDFQYGKYEHIATHRSFLINEYSIVKKAFKDIRKHVHANYYSMNGDVAKAVMDKQTTRALDGIVTIDHYVADPDQLAADIRRLVSQSGGNVVLGEFGAPIPDIHGSMDEAQQYAWVNEALKQVAEIDQVKGINYWTNKDSSTALWDIENKPKKVLSTLRSYYKRVAFFNYIHTIDSR